MNERMNELNDGVVKDENGTARAANPLQRELYTYAGTRAYCRYYRYYVHAGAHLDDAHSQWVSAAIALHHEARFARAAPEHVGVRKQARRSEYLHQPEGGSAQARRHHPRARLCGTQPSSRQARNGRGASSSSPAL